MKIPNQFSGYIAFFRVTLKIQVLLINNLELGDLQTTL
jgi:hypothetical protein